MAGSQRPESPFLAPKQKQTNKRTPSLSTGDRPCQPEGEDRDHSANTQWIKSCVCETPDLGAYRTAPSYAGKLFAFAGIGPNETGQHQFH